MKRQDKIDVLLKEVYSSRVNEIEDINNIIIPNMKDAFERFESNLLLENQKSNKHLFDKAVLYFRTKSLYGKTAILAGIFLILIMQGFIFTRINSNFGSGRRVVESETDKKGNDVFGISTEIEVSTLKEAENLSGFYVESPNYLVGTYKIEAIMVTDNPQGDKSVKQVYKNDTSQISIHKSLCSGEEGDFNGKVITASEKRIEFISSEYTHKARWYSDGFKYEINATADITEEEILKIIKNLK